jgi:hypothetical protein
VGIPCRFVIAAFVVAAGLTACSGGSHKAVTTSSSKASTTSSSTSTSASTTAPRATTSTTVAPTDLVPESATFISTTHAWVLESSHSECGNGDPACTHHVFTTVDGGTTWKALGLITDPAANLTMRFADATHGFAYDTTHVYESVDGGVHWSVLATPFTGVQNLAIARGFVYVVGYTTQLPNNFYIWSTPADAVAWARDPLKIPLGAGPVPMQSLAFSGRTGYLVNNDRTVIDGARLSITNIWVPWKPPCLTAGGTAMLSMSSPTDLVALCEEGVFTGPKVTNGAYFSTDSGTTFHRETAPAFGLISASGASAAVIANGDTIWLTTNAGATWAFAYGAHSTASGSALELGFTTPTQGYAILAGNIMVLTRDAGGAWTSWGP